MVTGLRTVFPGPLTGKAAGLLINAVLFVDIFSCLIPAQALMASVPAPVQRGGFSAINALVQQLSGGLASLASGHIVTTAADGKLQHFDTVGFVVAVSSLMSFLLLWRLQRGMADGGATR